MIALLLIELLLYLFGCTENGGSTGCDTALTAGKDKGVGGIALPGIESGTCEAIRLGIVIKRRQLGQRIVLPDEADTRLRVPQIQSTNIAGASRTDRIGLFASFGIVPHVFAAGLPDETSTRVLHSPHQIFVQRR